MLYIFYALTEGINKMTEEEEGYIKMECSIIWALATWNVMEEDNLDKGDMWNAQPYVEGAIE